MRKVFNSALIFCFMAGVALAQSNNPSSRTQSPGSATATARTAIIAPTSAPDELIGLLPASDVIAVVDVNRLFNELLPQVAKLQVGGLEKMARELTEFTQKTGIDPSKVQNAVLGFSLEGTQGKGVIIVSGLDLTTPQIEAAMKEFKTEFKTSDYKGKTVFSLLSKVKPPEAGPLSMKMDESALASLGGQKFAFGDLSVIKNVIDITSGAAKGGVTATMTGALSETRSSALLRFALNVPENLKQEAAGQGDLFKSVAAIKMVLGTFDVATDFSLSLDALIRTASQKDATELEDGLKGLVSLIKGIFGGGGSGDPKTDVIGQLLDHIKLGSNVNDVSLSITLPRTMLDQLAKKPAAAEKGAPAEKKP
jgi:hypothetical protein